ncbi:hypothetical protein ACVMIL_011579 [Bradyrhizobium barranii subsp. barranii]
MFWLAVKGDGFGAAFSHAFSGELEAVGVVDEAIENGVGDRGVPNGSMPGVHGELTCDDGGCAAMAVLEDFEQIAAFRGGERSQKLSAAEAFEEPGVTSVSARERERLEQPWNAMIED